MPAAAIETNKSAVETSSGDFGRIRHSPNPAKALGVELPSSAGQTLNDLLELRESRHAVAVTAMNKLRLMADERNTLEAKLPQLMSMETNSAFANSQNKAKIKAIKDEVVQRDREIAAFEKIVRKKEDDFQNIAGLSSKIIRWIKELDRDVFLQPIIIDLPKESNIEKLRKRIVGIQADEHRVRSAAYPAEVSKAASRSKIERMAAAGAPNVLTCIDGGKPFRFSHLRAADDFTLDSPDLSACQMAWLFKHEMIAKVEAEIDLIADDKNAISPAEREAQLAELAEERLAIEHMECEIIRTNPNQFEYRPDTDPRAVLNVSVEYADNRTPAERAAGY